MQKELLDTELDLYKKMQAGEEVTELRRKYTELQLEVGFITATQFTWKGADTVVNIKMVFRVLLTITATCGFVCVSVLG